MNFSKPTDTPRRAFATGFWRGLAAPAMLFSSVSLPSYAEPVKFEPLPVRGAKTMADDWRKVGEHLRAVIDRERRG